MYNRRLAYFIYLHPLPGNNPRPLLPFDYSTTKGYSITETTDTSLESRSTNIYFNSSVEYEPFDNQSIDSSIAMTSFNLKNTRVSDVTTEMTSSTYETITGDDVTSQDESMRSQRPVQELHVDGTISHQMLVVLNRASLDDQTEFSLFYQSQLKGQLNLLQDNQCIGKFLELSLQVGLCLGFCYCHHFDVFSLLNTLNLLCCTRVPFHKDLR